MIVGNFCLQLLSEITQKRKVNLIKKILETSGTMNYFGLH